ncbi:hypothetical protein QR662_15535, partial [Acinetobacter towneri]|nr:hypothetical protein [Acinetobacter towneri]
SSWSTCHKILHILMFITSFEEQSITYRSCSNFRIHLFYQNNDEYQNRFNSDDIRQICGYARDRKILKRLGYTDEDMQDIVVDCLIIYPDQNSSEILPKNLKVHSIDQFTKFYKIPVKLPTL